MNMDQTPIPFTCHLNRSWMKRGSCIIHIIGSMPDTKKATLAATCTMSDKMLPLLLIFKKAEDGRIANKEVSMLPQMELYAMQKSMDG